MKRGIIFGTVVIALGLLIALGPQFFFKVCDMKTTSIGETEDCCAEPETASCCAPAGNSFPLCHWSAQAEVGIGFLITALGICMIVFPDQKTQLGLYIGIFLAGIVAMFIPQTLIGGCGSMDMACHKVGFPAITAESIILLVFTAFIAVYGEVKKQI
ncbi:MAG: DUF4418 family protein [Treponema sp.]|jgi:hypothetical protein|nr:DUF4418 family protein [Treponema sp.]